MTNSAKPLSPRLTRYFAELIDNAPVNPEEKIRLQYFAVFVFLGVAIMIGYGLYDLVAGQLLLVSLMFFSASGLFFGWLLMCHLPLGQLVYRADAILYCGLLLYMLALGGENGSKSLWMFSFPLTVFFLLGKTEGSAWAGGLLAVAMAMLLVPVPGLSPYRYGNEFIIRFATVYLALSMIAFWLENLREHYLQSMEIEKQRLNDIIAALPDAITLKDLKGRHLLCNQAFQIMTDLTAEQILGKCDEDIFPDNRAKNTAGERDRPAATGPLRYDQTVFHADGQQAVYDPIKVPLKDCGGLVYGVLEIHRDITTQQEASRGADNQLQTFDITPVEQRTDEHRDHVEMPRRKKSATSVLLVDDDQLVREMGGMMLAHFGFTVLLAADGTEAIEMFRQHQDDIALVLCDVLMPRMDGWQTLAALRTLAPGIRFIMVSGLGQQEQDMSHKHSERPQAFLKKPYALAKLRDTISQVLGPAMPTV